MRLPTRQDGIENRDKVYSKSFCLSIFDHNTENRTRNTCVAEPREARGEAHKMSGMEEEEYWSKLGSLGGRVSTLALKLEGEM